MAYKKETVDGATKVTKALTGETVSTGNTVQNIPQTSQQANQSRNADPVSKQNAAEINRIYGNDGDPNDPYDRDYTAQSAKGYVPKDTTTVNNSMYYAKEQKMTDADRASLVNAGTYYNEAKSAGNEAGMKEAHELAERIRAKYGYSGGEDGSEFISDRPVDEYHSNETPSVTTPKKEVEVPQVSPLDNRAPDLTDLLDSWLSNAKKQQENKIDYGVNQGVLELRRAEEDAQQQFQTQQDQVDINEAKTLDNQALYAEARGDRGGIGQAQYGQIQADAMTNRRTINDARTKLATDTARQVADLRAQGEFEKADAILDLTQSYLTQLVDLEKWGAEFNLDVDKFNSQIDRWNAEFELAVSEVMGSYQDVPTLDYLKYQNGVDQWNQQFQTSKEQWTQEFDYETQNGSQDVLISAGLAALSVGVRPSAAQQAAMGYTDEQIEAQLSAYRLAQSSTGKGKGSGSSSSSSNSGSKPSSADSDPSSLDALMETMFLGGISGEAEAKFYLRGQGYTVSDSEDYAKAFSEKYGPGYLKDSENRNALYDKLGEQAKSMLTAIQRANGKNGTSGLSAADRAALLKAVENGSVSEYDLAIIRKLLGY